MAIETCKRPTPLLETLACELKVSAPVVGQFASSGAGGEPNHPENGVRGTGRLSAVASFITTGKFWTVHGTRNNPTNDSAMFA